METPAADISAVARVTAGAAPALPPPSVYSPGAPGKCIDRCAARAGPADGPGSGTRYGHCAQATVSSSVNTGCRCLL